MHDAVVEAVKVVGASGVPYCTDAMFTTFEGEWNEVFAVVKETTEAVAPLWFACFVSAQGRYS